MYDVEKEETSLNQTTPIYIFRYGGTNPGNLTPKARDATSGLSFSTIPQAGAAVTTIEAINATGVLHAVQDGVTHVTVYPVGGQHLIGSMREQSLYGLKR